jgi:hypothetical protein
VAVKLPELKSVAKLIEFARRYSGAVMPPMSHQSLPIPSPGMKGLRVAFLYCTATIIKPKEGLQMQTPAYVACLDAETGKFEEIKAIVPAEYGQKHQAGEVIGSCLTPPERLLPEYLTKQVKLFEAYDALLPPFAAGMAQVGAEVKKAAADFQTLFGQISEGPLAPYYQGVGKQFFDWLKKAAA